MSVALNHTIVHTPDHRRAAEELADLLGVAPPREFGPFWVLDLANDVSLDFMTNASPPMEHYAFLVSETEFDEILGRVRARGLPTWADPHQSRPDEINTNDGGRGVYWADPSGHFLEIITRPYGG